MITLVTTDYETSTFYTRKIDAHCVSTKTDQFVLCGKPTNTEIIEYANNNLVAPDSGNFNFWRVIPQEVRAGYKKQT